MKTEIISASAIVGQSSKVSIHTSFIHHISDRTIKELLTIERNKQLVSSKQTTHVMYVMWETERKKLQLTW